MSKVDPENTKKSNRLDPSSTADMPGPQLEAGSRIGHFRIDREIGRGGMGVVYLAHDTTLDRPVAIKSLPREVLADAKTTSRLRREAKLLAALNHPNIAAIYEQIEDAQGTGFLVLEYVPGRTLAERVAKGPMPLQEVLPVFAQIAHGLEAAHQAGIVHRDLKPSNITITDQGKVKILDFGVARAMAGDSPDQQSTLTQPGHVIGTPAYMSPEQARGRSVDKRADIWAFGCCLYEVLTGTHPFVGDTASDTLSRILDVEPDLKMLPGTVPSNIRVLLRRCLAKDVSKRLQDIGDARIEISETLDKTVNILTDQVSGTGSRRPVSLRGVVVLCLSCLSLGVLAALMASLAFRDTRNPVGDTTREVSLDPLPDGVSLLMSTGGSIAVSPDGRYRVYVGVDANETQRLYIRDTTEDFQPRVIQGTQRARSPFFKPDGEWIGFFAQDESTSQSSLKRVRVGGGAPEFVCRVPPLPCGGSWSRDDRIVFSPIYHQSLATVAAFGDDRVLEYPVPLDPNNNEHGQLWPDVLPNGKGIIYTVWGGDSRRDYRTMIQWTGVDKPQELLPDSSFARYVPAIGHIVFVRQGSLQAVPFDIDQPGTGPIRTTPISLVENVGATIFGAAHFAFAANEGTLVYAKGPSPLGLTESELVWVDPAQPDAAATVLAQSRGYYDEWSRPRLSPDEKLIATTPADQTNLLLYRFGTGYIGPFTVMKGWQGGAVWQPEPGRHLAFYGLGADSPPDIFWKLSENGDAAEPELLYSTRNSEQGCSFSPDGKYLAATIHHVSEVHLAQTSDILILEPGTGKEPMNWTGTTHCSEWGADFSPDGKWIAYTCDELGQNNVYLRQFPRGPRVKVGPGSEAMWRPGRRELELFYRGAGYMWKAQIQAEPELEVTGIDRVFKDEYLTTAFPGFRNYDYSKERGCFLMIKHVDEQPASVTELHVVRNLPVRSRTPVSSGSD